jgi:hypothetical protein
MSALDRLTEHTPLPPGAPTSYKSAQHKTSINACHALEWLLRGCCLFTFKLFTSFAAKRLASGAL